MKINVVYLKSFKLKLYCFVITEEFTPKNRKDWRNWLETNNSRTGGLWIIFYKKSSPNYNLSYEEARDEALCFGWIDSTKSKVDENKYKQYFSPRRKGSGWSNFNKKKINELILSGLMTEAGFKVIEEAKNNGNYYLLDNQNTLEPPNELKIEFKNNIEAKNNYNNLSKTKKKHIINQICLLKTEESRKRKSKKVVELLLTNKI